MHEYDTGKVRATLLDVAKAVGVSAKTVSRVVNQEKGVSGAKRLEIEAMIEELGFQPNRAAQALKGNRPKTIMLLTERVDSLYTLQLLTGALKETRRSGFNLVIDDYDAASPDARRRLVEGLHNSPVGGIVLTPPLCDDAGLLDAIIGLDVDIVRISSRSRPEIGRIVAVDEGAGAAEVARHLRDLGHRRVALVLGMESHAATRLRSIGFLSGWLDAGGDTAEIHIIRFEELVPPSSSQEDRTGSVAENLVDAGVVAARMIFDSTDRPTAIFAFNDAMALGLMWGANMHGISVPDDLSIVGFDGNIAASLVRPQLTTVHMPIKDLGESAVRLLTDKTFALPAMTARLIPGDTTRAIPGR